MNQTELSGFMVPIILSYLTGTGSLSGAFYPLKTNPSGYLQSGAFISQMDLDSAVAQTLSFVASQYYLQSNPSGFITTGGGGGGTGSSVLGFYSNCTSGVQSESIFYPSSLTGIPKISCSFVNNVDDNSYFLSVSNINTTGFNIHYSDFIGNTGYQVSVIADL